MDDNYRNSRYGFNSEYIRKMKFIGEVDLRELEDGRKMKLLSNFSFLDNNLKYWFAPEGIIVDGASIPRVFWRLTPPFVGKYRRASVLHDHYCIIKTESYSDTHKMFYEAMLCDGVNKMLAYTMYKAVLWFGPRWD